MVLIRMTNVLRVNYFAVKNSSLYYTKVVICNVVALASFVLEVTITLFYTGNDI